MQHPLIFTKEEHGSDQFSFCIINKIPFIADFDVVLSDIRKRGIEYSEHFVAQIVGLILETVKFCHKHNVVNMNLQLG